MSTPAASSSIDGGALRLSDLTLLRARGPDAGTFLQSQLTQDVLGLSKDQVRLSGYCSPKGRLLASLWVWRMADDAFGLLCSTDLAVTLLKRLSMYVLRAKCKLDDASSEWTVWGLAGAVSQQWLAGDAVSPGRATMRDGAWVLGLPAAEGVARHLLVQPAHASAPPLPTLQESRWQRLEVASGVPRITAATVEQFVPQMINLERVGGVDFQKGCYPGQEVVARSQYRGTLKRRMHLFATDGEARPGQELFHSGDPSQPAGMVVNAASDASGTRLLAEVKLAALDSGSLHLGGAQGAALHRLELPYSVATTADA
ncbi:MAG: folate-binding protein YgfZ [Burkholderiaceae bacterium]|nr:folate-binding protein YgfZ [Burkholderiaceae bacterium]